MGSRRPRPVVLDAGALVAFERNDRRLRRLVELATEYEVALHTPAGAVAQTWRDGARQVRLARLLGSGQVAVRVLDEQEAKAAGVLCGRSGHADIVDASVVLLARRHDAAVVSSDRGDVLGIDPTLVVIDC